MEKIPTIFDRDWDKRGKHGSNPVINKPLIDLAILSDCVATEKLDGTNIRLTIRCGKVVRIEKRKNPTKEQKKEGIKDPWYIDVNNGDPSDQYIIDAVHGRRYKKIPDGEWSAEALGDKIQGNPLKLTKRTVCIFSCDEAPKFPDVPHTYDELKTWLPCQTSRFNTMTEVCIEGIVWHYPDGKKYKIKVKDF